MERLKCSKCEGEAIMIYANRQLCGECILKIMDILNKQKQDIIDGI